MSPGRIDDQKRVVVLGQPKYAGDEYLKSFSQDFALTILEANDHAETLKKLPLEVSQNGPIDAFIIRMGTNPYEPFDETLFSPLLADCKIVCSASAGYNEFPVDWLAKQNVLFCNTVDAVAEATADMAMFLTLATLRNTSMAEKSAKAGTWRSAPGIVPARDPSGLTLGIVGMGAIGKYLAKKAVAFNMTIKYFNRKRLPADVENRFGATYCGSLHELLAAADVVSVNCPLNGETTGMIGHAEFEVMKDGVFFVNTARGAVVQEAALKDALERGKVARAGLDVMCNEPDVDPYFLQNDRVIVQPHLGGLTDVAFQRAERECFENVRSYFTTGVPHSAVRQLATAKKID